MKNILKKFIKHSTTKSVQYGNENWKVVFDNDFSITSTTFTMILSNDSTYKMDHAISVGPYNQFCFKETNYGCYFVCDHSDSLTLTNTEIDDIIQENSAYLFQKSLTLSKNMINLIQCYIKHKRNASDIFKELGYCSFTLLDLHSRDINTVLEELYNEYEKSSS